MQETSAADHTLEGAATERRLLRVDSPILSRRRFLREGAVTLAGIAALSGVEWMRPPHALAQSGQPGSSPVSQLVLLNTTAVAPGGDYCQGKQLLVGRHAYRFDYRYGMGNPPTVPKGLVGTYRDGLCDVVTELQRVQRPTPFDTPDAAPPQFPDPPPDGQFSELDCYRLIQPLGDQQTVRVYEWCSFYCAQGNTMIVQVDGPNQSFQYNPKGPGAGPPVPVNQQNSFPRVHFATPVASGAPDAAIGAGFFQADNRQQGFSDETLWTTNLPIQTRQSLRVDTFIPGAADPSTRTAQARYEVSFADGIKVVTVSQQRAASGWVTLGVFEFENVPASVHLTNETGEPTGSTEVVADTIRWSSA